jgi:hypothetical protein
VHRVRFGRDAGVPCQAFRYREMRRA